MFILMLDTNEDITSEIEQTLLTPPISPNPL